MKVIDKLPEVIVTNIKAAFDSLDPDELVDA